MEASSPFRRNVHCLLGLPVDVVDVGDAVRTVRESAARRRRCFLATPNVNIVLDCIADTSHREAVTGADLVIVDGMPLVWVARLLRIPIRERVAGSTVFDHLRFDGGPRLSVFFFGGAKGVAEEACCRLASEARGLRCAGFEFPGFGAVDEMCSQAVIDRINASGADFLVVSLGARKGHTWIRRCVDQLTVPVVSHLGAVVNFVAGTVSRAPSWMQRLGVEWVWRIKEEPALWRRYFQEAFVLLAIFLTRVLPHACYLRWHRIDPAEVERASVAVSKAAESMRIRLQGAWCEANLGPLRACLGEAVTLRGNIVIEMDDVTYVDSAFVGLIVLLHSQQRQYGRHLDIHAPSNAVRRIMSYCCADYVLPEVEQASQ